MHACQYSGELFGIAFGDRTYSTCVFRLGIFNEIKLIVTTLRIKRVSCANVFQFDCGADITCFKGLYRVTELTANGKNLSETLFAATRDVLKVFSCLESSAHNLEI